MLKKKQQELENEKKLKMKSNLDKRMNAKEKKVGKADMKRSDKPKIHRQKEKIEVDEQADLEKRYLGFALKDIDQQVAGGNTKDQ